MEFLVASGVAAISGTGVYLLLRRRTFSVVLGLMMLGYAVNVILFAMGRLHLGTPAILDQTSKVTDPLPQALVLTAIVIGFATTVFLVQLAARSRFESGTDHVDAKEDEPVFYDPRDDAL